MAVERRCSMWKQPFWLRMEAQRRTFSATYALHLSRQLPACRERLRRTLVSL
jgi:hypothetical protein